MKVVPCLFGPLVLATLTLQLQKASTPLALEAASSFNSWYGSDGIWSAVSVRIGSPQQYISAIVSTDRTELWAVSSSACPASNYTACSTAVGGLYNTSASSTWDNIGAFDAFSDTRGAAQGLTLPAEYGTDDVAVGSSITLKDHLLATFQNVTLFEAGVFGLGVANTTLGNDTEYPTLLQVLYNNGNIPSLTYGYTAGAYYREKHVLCSVTLGGYDLSRFTPSNLTFSLTPDLKPVAALFGILMTANGTTETSLSTSSLSIYIDSTTPYLWLPVASCELFAKALGLVWSASDSLYYYTSTSSYNSLKSRDIAFQFDLRNSTESSQSGSVPLSIPFAAFDLQHTFANGTSTPYFPLKRATSEDEYTLGRAFLQETYLVVDYNRVTFSISAAMFDGNTGDYPNLVTLTDELTVGENGPITTTTQTSQSSTTAATTTAAATAAATSGTTHKSLRGAIVGGAVAGSVVLLFVLIAILVIFRRSRKKSYAKELRDAPQTFPTELVDDLNDQDAMRKPVEIAPTTPRAELEGDPIGGAVELPTHEEWKGIQKDSLELDKKDLVMETDHSSPLTPYHTKQFDDDGNLISNAGIGNRLAKDEDEKRA